MGIIVRKDVRINYHIWIINYKIKQNVIKRKMLSIKSDMLYGSFGRKERESGKKITWINHNPTRKHNCYSKWNY